MRSRCELLELDVYQFTAELDRLTEIYAEAMDAPAAHLPGRRALMERHATYREFRAIAVRPLRRPGVPGPGSDAAGAALRVAAGTAAGPPPIIAFAYGFHGSPGQWWHDLVSDTLRRSGHAGLARRWLTDSFEIAEVHVQPGRQGQGIGRAMMHRLTAGRPERTAVLSTPEGESRASRLYHGLGFTALLAQFRFPGAEQPYAIMGAALPLRERPRSASPSRW